ncbi:MAG: DUF4097 domain-containing protein [Lachnospiraceae bacterium]|jgi:hypothetical protein|nr:DUF4097 domain-containing protein [Lachnospiraceae bacterium]
MKKFTKVCLLIAAVLMMLGLTACAAGAVMGAGSTTLRELWDDGDLNIWGWRIGKDGIGWIHDDDWMDGEEFVDRFQAAEIHGMDIYLKHTYLEIEESDTDEVILTVERNDGEFQSSLKDGILTLRDERSGHHARRNYEVKLELPKGMELKEIKIENRAGVLESDDFVLKADKIDIQGGAGEVELDRVKTKEFYLEVGAGNADIQNLDAEKADISCGVGNIDIQLMGKELDYNYELSCGIGNVNIGLESYSGLGRTKKIDNSASKTVRLECGVGNITVDME